MPSSPTIGQFIDLGEISVLGHLNEMPSSPTIGQFIDLGEISVLGHLNEMPSSPTIGQFEKIYCATCVYIKQIPVLYLLQRIKQGYNN